MSKSVGLLVILLAISTSAFSQNNCQLKLSGQVIDEHDQSALSYASVQLLNTNYGVSADGEGKYELKGLCPGNYKLVVAHLGCEPDTIVIELVKNLHLDLFLEHHTEELQQVTIETSRNEDQGVVKQKMKQEEVFKKSGLPMAKMLESINGVNTLNTGSNISKPVIQGFTNNRVQILNHGVEHQGQNWGDEHAPEIDPFASASYSVIKGAGAVRYGNGAIGGVVLVEPKPLPQDAGIKAEFNSMLATNNRLGATSLMLEGKFKSLPNFAWRVQGSLKKGGNIRTPNYYQRNSGVEEFNYSYLLAYSASNWTAKLHYSLFNSNVGIFSGAHIGNLTDLRNAIAMNKPREQDLEGFSYEIRRPYQRLIHELFKVEFKRYFEKMGQVELSISRQFNIREEFDRGLPRDPFLRSLNIPEFSLSLESYVGQANWQLPTKKNINTSIGVTAKSIRNTINSFVDFIPDYESQVIGFYGITKKTFVKGQVEFGLRFDQNQMDVKQYTQRGIVRSEQNFNAFTANFGGFRRFGNDWTWKANISYAERPPAINELYSDGLHHGTASLEFGNQELKKEKALAINTALEGKWNNLDIEFDAFLQRINDFIYLSPQGVDLTIRGAFPSFDWMNVDGLFRGADFKLGHKVYKNLDWEGSANFLWANDLTSNSFLVNIPANRYRNVLRYQFKVKRKQDDLSLELNHQFVDRQNRFDEEEEIAPPPEAYQLVGASLSYSTKRKKMAYQMALEVNNALNEVYRDYMNRFRFYTDEQGLDIQFRLKINLL